MLALKICVRSCSAAARAYTGPQRDRWRGYNCDKFCVIAYISPKINLPAADFLLSPLPLGSGADTPLPPSLSVLPHPKSLTCVDRSCKAPLEPRALCASARGEGLARSPLAGVGTWPSLGTIYLRGAPSRSPAALRDGPAASVKGKRLQNCHAFKAAPSKSTR